MSNALSPDPGLTAGGAAVTVTPERFSAGIIEPADFIADTEAFLDVRIARSKGKASYSMIGPGVSQNADQSVNLTEAHGFNIGAASMPHGVVNNPHMHYTAEVFVCTRGEWEFAVGEHGEQRLDIGPNTVFSVPTWVFRGFTNTGPDDGWLFTALGGDDTGGILWAPHVLAEAAETGLYLRPDYSVFEPGDVPPADSVVSPLSADVLAGIDSYTDAELEQCVVRPDDRRWSADALLSTVLDGHDVEVAPVIGHGLSQDRSQRPPITSPHGFSVDWIRAHPGAGTGLHRIDQPQVLILGEGSWSVAVNTGAEALIAEPEAGSVISVPAGAWRTFRSAGDGPADAVVVTGGEAATEITWSDEILRAARSAGWGVDAGGYRAPIELLARP
ncbi:MAG: hypothetical protein AAF467_26690 [Actinomycetota bacterium]